MENILYLFDTFNSANCKIFCNYDMIIQKCSTIYLLTDYQKFKTLFTSTDSPDVVGPQMVCYPNYKTVKVSAHLSLPILPNFPLMYIPDF